jgi:predicted RecA/RadA family phage recombinase
MKNEQFYPNDPADKLSLPVPADTASGAPVLVGALPGVTACAEGDGGNVDGNASVWLAGVFRLPIGTTTAIAVGGPVYITAGGALTPVATGNTLFGHVVVAKGTTAGEIVPVKLAKV